MFPDMFPRISWGSDQSRLYWCGKLVYVVSAALTLSFLSRCCHIVDMDAPPAGPTPSDNELENTGTPNSQSKTIVSGPAQSPFGGEPCPPIANALISVLDSPPQRHDDGYYVRSVVLSWRDELEAELVSVCPIIKI